jgi:hypothetical protein
MLDIGSCSTGSDQENSPLEVLMSLGVPFKVLVSFLDLFQVLRRDSSSSIDMLNECHFARLNW